MKPILTSALAACLALTFVAAAEPDKPGTPATKAEPKRYKFEFRDKRWRDVLEWLSQQSGKPFNGSAPGGTFTFIPPAGKTYTIPEITDILNEALTEQRFVLLWREKSFVIVPSDELKKVDREPAQVEIITVANLDPAKAAQTLKAMFADMRGIFIEADTARSAVILRASREQIIEIKLAIKTLEAGVPTAPNVKTLTLESGSAADLANEIARALRELRPNAPVRVIEPGKELPKDAPKDKALTILAAGDRLIFYGDDAQSLATAQEVARLYASAGTKQGESVVIRLKSADAVATARALDEMFNGPRAPMRPAERVRVVADAATNALLVKASPVDLLTVRRLLQTHFDAGDQELQSSAQTFLIGPLKHASAAELARLVREVFQGERPAHGFTVTADPRTRMIVLRCSRVLYAEATRLVEQLDTPVEPKK